MSATKVTVVVALMIGGCVRTSRIAPPSGLYTAQATIVQDTCIARAKVSGPEQHVFVVTSVSDSQARANVPLAINGAEWEELASRATIDLDQTMTLIDSPAASCENARRRRDIRVTGSRADGFELEVTETWSVPGGDDCVLPERASCVRVERIALRVERPCTSDREIALLQCTKHDE